MKTKVLKGLDSTHFAPFKNGNFETPVAIENSKSIEASLKFEAEQEWADNRIVDSSSQFAGGEGKAKFLGLYKEEQVLLFGNKEVKGGVAVYSGDIAPIGAFLFRRKKSNGHYRLYVVYACQCNPAGFSGETIEEGKGKGGEEEIEFSIGEMQDGLIYHYIDTDDSTVDQEQVSKWFTEVQFPQELESRVLKKENKNQ